MAAAAVGATLALPAQAAGFAGSPGAAVLGQPLDIAVPLRLSPGETAAATCVAAEVASGDQRISPDSVRATLETTAGGGARVRVTTGVRVDEPVVTVTIHLGCAARQSRRFTVLADPPPSVAVLAAAAPGMPAAAAAAPAAVAPAPPAPPAVAGPLPSAGPGAATSPPAAPGVAGPTAERSGATATPDRVAGAPAASPSAPGGTGAVEPRTADEARDAGTVAPRPAAAPARPVTVRPRPVAPPPAVATVAPPRREAAERRREPAPSRTAAAASAASVPSAAAASAVPPAAVAAAASGASSGSAGVPRLKLETGAADADLAAIAAQGPARAQVESALRAVAQAASAAELAGAAASAAQSRIAVLERRVEQLQGEARASREREQAWRERASQQARAGEWTLPLALLAGAFGLLAAFLAWRLAQHQRLTREVLAAAAAGELPLRARRAGVAAPVRGVAGRGDPVGQGDAPDAAPDAATASAAAATGEPAAWAPGMPWVDSDVPDPLPPPARRPAAPGVPGTAASAAATDAGDDNAVAATLPLAGTARMPLTGARDVAVEELIDLEQQAEFFIVLGQDEAAIDLLVDHLRGTGGSSPLPYLKLLEIHHRRGDHAAYERMRTRFNHRFNAYAPKWGEDLAHGRTLEHYSAVLPRLQAAWPRPLDAMAELEALLFRKTRGELFELPAYREVLFLYALARDLLDREAADTGTVDLLLPLAGDGEFATTAPGALLPADGRVAAAGASDDDRPTAPVDFDLTAPSSPPSIFDPPLPGIGPSASRPR